MANRRVERLERGIVESGGFEHGIVGDGAASADDSAESSGLSLFGDRSALSDPATVGAGEHEHAGVGDRDAEPALVQERVMKATERDEVAELRLAAVAQCFTW